MQCFLLENSFNAFLIYFMTSIKYFSLIVFFDRQRNTYWQNISMNEWNFKVVKYFKCLGSVLTPENEVRIGVNERLVAGSRYFYAL